MVGDLEGRVGFEVEAVDALVVVEVEDLLHHQWLRVVAGEEDEFDDLHHLLGLGVVAEQPAHVEPQFLEFVADALVLSAVEGKGAEAVQPVGGALGDELVDDFGVVDGGGDVQGSAEVLVAGVDVVVLLFHEVLDFGEVAFCDLFAEDC